MANRPSSRELLRRLAALARSAPWTSEGLMSLGALSRGAVHFRGRARIQRLLTRVRSEFGDVSAVPIELDGVRWVLDLRELIQFRLFWDGAHDGHVRSFLERESAGRSRCVVWDIGANVGALALPLASRLPQVRIEAFEPSPEVFAKLARHRADNPGLDVHIHRVALGDRDGTTEFFASSELGNAGLGSLARAHNTLDVPVEVRLARGDALVAAGEVEAPDLVKIDVEGFELECLEGLAETLRTRRPLLCVESSSYRLEARGLPKDAIARKLKQLGYHLAVLTPDGERSLRDGDFDTNFDLAARPR